MSDNNVVLQNLRDFTVQIRRADTQAIVGTGVVVSMDGQVVTCAHVVQAALGKHPREAIGAEVGVYFPQLRGGETKERRAHIAGCFPQHDDDVVVLCLTDNQTPLGPEQIAVLGVADYSDDDPFRSYGYRRLSGYNAGFATGTISGAVEPPLNRNVQTDPIQLESSQINRGMSGAAVLDTERNLVVGIVSETWFPDQSTKDRDTAWAINARVLTFDPFNFSVRIEPLAKKPAPQSRFDVKQAQDAVAPNLSMMFKGAPEPLKEWVGREELLAHLTEDWNDGSKHITGLIGFGGEGKSSLARWWVDEVRASATPPDGVFWWNFYDSPNVDEFFEAALKYMSGDRIDPRQIPSANLRAQIIGAMLGKGRYLFVLDGLEVMQHNEGDQYGLLNSGDLREFLSFFAAKDNASFALITSRAPLTDLMVYDTYTHREVDRLSEAEGRALLRKIGVHGNDAALDKVVADWDGHALTLSLIGAYLVDRYQGDVAHLADLPAPTADEPRYQRVHRVLRRYDEHLTEAERAFLMLFSAFRTPVPEGAFEKVFRAKPEKEPGLRDRLQDKAQSLNAPLVKMTDAAFNALIKRLTDYRILRYDTVAHTYTTHPLIRTHYFVRLMAGDVAQTHVAHERIKDYYLSTSGETPRSPTLDDLKPLIEVVYHACRAGAYDEAWSIYWERIQQTSNFVLTQKLGACETDLALMREFFPTGDTTQEPQVSNPRAKSFILNQVGLCQMDLGRLSEAVQFFARANQIKINITRRLAQRQYGLPEPCGTACPFGSVDRRRRSRRASR